MTISIARRGVMLAASGILMLALLRQIPAQEPSRAVEFEAATLKPYQPVPPGNTVFSGGSCHGVDNDKQYLPGPIAPPPLGRCVFKRVSLTGLLGFAYKARATGGASWTTSDYFDVEAKAEDASTATEARLLEMLQTFVTSRFNVGFHREQREVQGFSLFVGRNRQKLKEAVGDDPPSVRFGPGATVTARHVTMTYFADLIRGVAGGPVTDKTGLTGAYDFAFEWQTADPGGFLSELQVQLGLRVESTKVPMQFLIIDRAEKPAQQ